MTLVDSRGDQFTYIQTVFTNAVVIEEEIINEKEQVGEEAEDKAEEKDEETD